MVGILMRQTPVEIATEFADELNTAPEHTAAMFRVLLRRIANAGYLTNVHRSDVLALQPSGPDPDLSIAQYLSIRYTINGVLALDDDAKRLG